MMQTGSWSIMACLKTRWSTSLVRSEASSEGKVLNPTSRKLDMIKTCCLQTCSPLKLSDLLQGISFPLSSALTWTDSLNGSPISVTLFLTSRKLDLIQDSPLSKQLSLWLTQLLISVNLSQIPHHFVSPLSTNLSSLRWHQIFRKPIKALSFCLICSTSRNSQIANSVVTSNVPIWFWVFRIMQASILAHTVSLINMALTKAALVNLNLGPLS